MVGYPGGPHPLSIQMTLAFGQSDRGQSDGSFFRSNSYFSIGGAG